MEVKPVHILAAGVFAFTAIVAANMLTQWQSNASFRARLQKIDPANLLSIRTKRVAEEQMQSVPESDDEGE